MKTAVETPRGQWNGSRLDFRKKRDIRTWPTFYTITNIEVSTFRVQ